MLGTKLRDLRVSRKQNQSEIADYLGVKRQTYGAYERNVSVPDAFTLLKIADYFDVSLDYLFERPAKYTYRMSPNQIDLLDRYRKLSVQGRKMLLCYMDFVATQYKDDAYEDSDAVHSSSSPQGDQGEPSASKRETVDTPPTDLDV